VAINRERAAVTAAVATGMPPGTYCDILTGGLVAMACIGTAVVVDASGTIQLQLAANSGLAIDAATRHP
jgi:alpha-amylase